MEETETGRREGEDKKNDGRGRKEETERERGQLREEESSRLGVRGLETAEVDGARTDYEESHVSYNNP